MRCYTCPVDEEITTPWSHLSRLPLNVGRNCSSVQSCPCLIAGFLGCLLTLAVGLPPHPILHVATRMGTQQVERQMSEKEQSLWLWLPRWQLMTCWQGKDERNVGRWEVIILNEILRVWKLKSKVSLKINCLAPSFYKSGNRVSSGCRWSQSWCGLITLSLSSLNKRSIILFDQVQKHSEHFSLIHFSPTPAIWFPAQRQILLADLLCPPRDILCMSKIGFFFLF